MQIWKNWEICKIENNQKVVIFKSFLGKYITTKPQFSCYFLQLIILFHYITVPTKLGAVRFVLYVFSFLHTHTLPSMQSPCYAYIIIIFLSRISYRPYNCQHNLYMTKKSMFNAYSQFVSGKKICYLNIQVYAYWLICYISKASVWYILNSSYPLSHIVDKSALVLGFLESTTMGFFH